MDLHTAFKYSLAFATGMTLLPRWLLALQKRKLKGRYIRTINMHDTPHSSMANFRRQMRFFARHFNSACEADLQILLSDGHWGKPKPGLIITFDDGLRTNYDVAAPLLEEFG